MVFGSMTLEKLTLMANILSMVSLLHSRKGPPVPMPALLTRPSAAPNLASIELNVSVKD